MKHLAGWLIGALFLFVFIIPGAINFFELVASIWR
jgi:hypothetical protein